MTQTHRETTSTATLCGHCGHDTRHVATHGHSFLEEAVELGLHFDYRHVRSLPLLLVPGVLAQKYCSDERARFSPPLKIYVFLSLLFFALYFTHHIRGSATLRVTGDGLAGTTSAESHHQAGEQESSGRSELSPEAAKDHLELDGERVSFGLNFEWPEWVSYFVAEGAHIDSERMVQNITKTVPMGLFFVFPLVSLLLSWIYRGNKDTGFWQHMAFVLYAQSALYLWLLLMEFLDYTHDHLSWQPLHSLPLISFLLMCAFMFASQQRFYAEPLRKTALKYVLLVSAYVVSIGFMTLLSFAVAALLAVEY